VIKLRELLESSVKDVVSIFESPLRLNKPYNPNNLNSIGRNSIFTDIVIEKTKNVGNFKEYTIYEYVVGSDIFNILELNGYTCGFFQYKINSDIAEEIGVWQSPTNIGLCRSFIFEFLLKKYDGFLSDDAHTELGQKYWDKLLKNAITLGYKVFVVEKDKKTELNADTDIDGFYNNSPKGLDYKFLIIK